jgi:hypothetical protein
LAGVVAEGLRWDSVGTSLPADRDTQQQQQVDDAQIVLVGGLQLLQTEEYDGTLYVHAFGSPCCGMYDSALLQVLLARLSCMLCVQMLAAADSCLSRHNS